jgi:HEAT repeat protein
MSTHRRLALCSPRPIRRFRRLCCVVSVLVTGLSGVTGAIAWADDSLLPPATEIEQAVGVDLPVDTDPALPTRAVERVPEPRLAELWGEALDRDEAELQAQAASAIAEVHRRGFGGMAELAPLLARRLGEVEHPQARVAILDACAALDVREALPIIERLASQGDRAVAMAADRAMAAMGYTDAATLWAQRILDEQAAITMRRSAIRAMGQLGTQARGEPLLAVASDPQQPQSLRLEAARALARAGAAPSGLIETARDMGEKEDWFDRLVGVTMLGAVRDDAKSGPLKRFADDPSPVVAAEALRQLGNVQPAACLGLQRPPWQREDANVRYQAVRCLFAYGEPAAYEPLAVMLDDTDPRTRRLAHWALLQLSKPDGPNQAMSSTVNRTLVDASWRGLERAALLLGQWDHEPVSSRLVELLDHERAEVRLAAATGLRRLAVRETLPALLQRAERITLRMRSMLEQGGTFTEVVPLDREQSQLFAALGEMRYREADSLLRPYLPKNSFPSGSRAAAVWALGKIHAGRLDPSLAGTLRGRLSDTNLMEPESEEVRVQAAIALARIGADGQANALRRFASSQESSDEVQAACRWAIEHLTGEPQPPPPPTEIKPDGDWFLAPLNE